MQRTYFTSVWIWSADILVRDSETDFTDARTYWMNWVTDPSKTSLDSHSSGHINPNKSEGRAFRFGICNGIRYKDSKLILLPSRIRISAKFFARAFLTCIIFDFDTAFSLSSQSTSSNSCRHDMRLYMSWLEKYPFPFSIRGNASLNNVSQKLQTQNDHDDDLPLEARRGWRFLKYLLFWRYSVNQHENEESTGFLQFARFLHLTKLAVSSWCDKDISLIVLWMNCID